MINKRTSLFRGHRYIFSNSHKSYYHYDEGPLNRYRYCDCARDFNLKLRVGGIITNNRCIRNKKEILKDFLENL